MSDLELPESLELPMENGEVVFEAPWQGRIFGMAVALSEQGLFTWAEFQQELINYVGTWDGRPSATKEATSGYAYYDHFSDALTAVLQSKKTVSGAEIDEREAVLRSRPHDHDHQH
ncbi:MAG: nitrile hydratase accessory protein [Limisphaerales bacterium]|jgi:nitrile hydratase accessory protein